MAPSNRHSNELRASFRSPFHTGGDGGRKGARGCPLEGADRRTFLRRKDVRLPVQLQRAMAAEAEAAREARAKVSPTCCGHQHCPRHPSRTPLRSTAPRRSAGDQTLYLARSLIAATLNWRDKIICSSKSGVRQIRYHT